MRRYFILIAVAISLMALFEGIRANEESSSGSPDTDEKSAETPTGTTEVTPTNTTTGTTTSNNTGTPNNLFCGKNCEDVCFKYKPCIDYCGTSQKKCNQQ